MYKMPNDEIGKMGIWSKANTPEYDKGFDNIRWDHYKPDTPPSAASAKDVNSGHDVPHGGSK